MSNGIPISEMSDILADLDYPVEIAAGALHCVYSLTSYNELVLALKNSYIDIDRIEMIEALQWKGSLVDPGVYLDRIASIHAVTPHFPCIVLTYGANISRLRATTIGDLPVVVYEESLCHCGRKFNVIWTLYSADCANILDVDLIYFHHYGEDYFFDLGDAGGFNSDLEWIPYEHTLFPNIEDLHLQLRCLFSLIVPL